MRLWKPRKAPKSPALYRWLAIGMAALVLAVSAGFVRETMRSRQIDSQIAALKAESENLRAKNFEIVSMRSAMGRTEATEREARLKLGLRKEGEHVVVIRPPTTVAATLAVAAPSEPKEEIPNTKKWWLYFMDRNTLDAYGPARPEPTEESAIQ